MQGGLTDEVNALPIACWWHRDGYPVFNNTNGDDLILRKDVLAILSLHSAAPQEQAERADDLDEQTIRERDYNADMADKLAAGIAEHFGQDIGEHSSANCPWTNALEILDTKPEFAPCAGTTTPANAAAANGDGLRPEYGSLADNLRIEQTDSGRWVVCVENWFPSEESARAACRKWKVAYSSAPPLNVMVDRFLGWKLPHDFYPDAGISFDRAYSEKWGMPSGTNLFHAGQAKAMFEHCMGIDKASAADADGQKPYQVTIGGDGFFAGCKVMIDPALPPDTVEMRGAIRVRLSIKTGEIAVAPTHQPAPQTSGKEGEFDGQ